MIRLSKIADERREAGAVDCWCLHGAVGLAADWRGVGKRLAEHGVGTRAVDLWRFLDCAPMPLPEFGTALSAEAAGEVFRGSGRMLAGYSMGGRLALHALLADASPWQAAVIISAHPGLEGEDERAARRAHDAEWAMRALAGDWGAFLNDWNAQPVLAGGTPAFDDASRASRLMPRRREIARSFVDWSLGGQEPLWDRLPEIRVPVLWITGANDPKFTDLAARACALMPAASHVVIEGAGHRVPWDQEVAFCEALTTFSRTGKLAG
jgi:2-succinyl-6-hydroxy-2,4-cyclohexadiene-1-carboxylate synthase